MYGKFPLPSISSIKFPVLSRTVFPKQFLSVATLGRSQCCRGILLPYHTEFTECVAVYFYFILPGLRQCCGNKTRR
jgi:hypothetical protein